ncbi:MAG: class I SAM-dependent methyltransferase [Flavobacteriales bacterium]|nr:class I SAM-dependent methyltransferase [Flavobacteriales bacterium]
MEEESRYKLHNNNIEDQGYRKFVEPVVNAIIELYSSTSHGLDFGAGPGPVLAEMLNKAGYHLELYDPIFHKNPELLTKSYDYIICCEVIEHFHQPHREFKLLRSLLNKNGALVAMTHIYCCEIDFEKWYYKNDFTHVFFYQIETLEWIKTEFSFSKLEVKNRLIKFII